MQGVDFTIDDWTVRPQRGLIARGKEAIRVAHGEMGGQPPSWGSVSI